MQLSKANLIWNRSLDGGGSQPAKGDIALRAMLYAHGLAMNGGVLHAVESLDESELAAAIAGYRFFSLDALGDLLMRAISLVRSGANLEAHEALLDRQYCEIIPDDSRLFGFFERHLIAEPRDFAPL
jgi:hypothetical protein